MTELVDDLVGNPDDIEVDDLTSGAPNNDINDTGQEGVSGVACDDHTTDGDTVGRVGLVEEGPHEAGGVDLVDIGGKGDPCGQERFLR